MTHVEVLTEAHQLRVKRGDPNIAEVHLADAIENLTRERRESLSKNRAPKNPYAREAATSARGRRERARTQRAERRADRSSRTA